MIQSIAFLTYAVSDIKAARHFYEDILGLKLTHQEDITRNTWPTYRFIRPLIRRIEIGRAHV